MKKLLYVLIPIDIILIISSVFFAYRQIEMILSLSLHSDVIGYSSGQEFLFLKIPFGGGMNINISSYGIYISTIVCLIITIWLKLKTAKSRQ